MKIDKGAYKKQPKVKKMLYGTQDYQGSYVIDPNKSDVNNNSGQYNEDVLQKNQDSTTKTKAAWGTAATAVSAVPVVGTVIGAAMHAGNATDSIGRKIPGAVDERGYATNSAAGTLGKMASPIEGIKNLGSGNNADTAAGLSTFLTGGSSSLLMGLTGTKTDPIFGKSSSQEAKEEYEKQKKYQTQLQNFMNSKVDDNYAMFKKNRQDKQVATWGRSNTSSGPMIAELGIKKNSKVGIIEIEGKKAPEIHTNEKMDTVKNLGTRPHKAGGDKVVAQEGDVVFNTQNSPAKYKRIMGAIATGDKETLEKERMKIPGGEDEKMKSGTKGFVADKNGYRSHVDNYGHTYVKTPSGKYLYKPKGSSTFKEEKTKNSIDAIEKMQPKFKDAAKNSGSTSDLAPKSPSMIGAKQASPGFDFQAKVDSLKTNSMPMDENADKRFENPVTSGNSAQPTGKSLKARIGGIGKNIDNQKIKDMVGAGAEIVPILHNLLQKPVYPNQRGKLYSRLNQNISTVNAENAITADQFAANKYNAVEQSGGNTSNARANTIAANNMARQERANSITNDAQKYAQVQNSNNAIRNDDAKFNYENDFLNQREKYQVRAQKQEQITDAMSQIGQLGARSRERVAEQNYNKEYLDTVKELYNQNKLNKSLSSSSAPIEKNGTKSLKLAYKKK